LEKYSYKQLVLIVVILLIIAGCAPKGIGPAFNAYDVSENSGFAKVCHYRVERFIGSGAFCFLYCNDEKITQIGNGGYLIQTLEPGFYEFEKRDRYDSGLILIILSFIGNVTAQVEPVYSLEVEANKNYYFRWEPPGEIEEVQESIALEELKGLKQFGFEEEASPKPRSHEYKDAKGQNHYKEIPNDMKDSNLSKPSGSDSPSVSDQKDKGSEETFNDDSFNMGL